MKMDRKTASTLAPMIAVLIIAVFTIAALMIAVIPSSAGSYQAITLGGHNISLDFDGQNIEVLPTVADYEECTGVSEYYVKMVDPGSNSSSFAYLFRYDSPRFIRDLGTELGSIMGAMCGKMSIQPYENGYISDGPARLEGQELWGIIAPLDGEISACVEIVASFKNGSLNEHLVKSARLNGTGLHLVVPQIN